MGRNKNMDEYLSTDILLDIQEELIWLTEMQNRIFYDEIKAKEKQGEDTRWSQIS